MEPFPSNPGFQVHNLSRLYKNFFAILTDHIRPRIFVEHWALLNLLKNNPVLSQTDLLSPFSETMSALTRTLKVMEKRGWITRKKDRTDRRRINVSLTKKGDALYHQVLQLSLPARSQLFSVLSTEEKKIWFTLTAKLESKVIQEIETLKKNSGRK